jgi:DNA repair protein RadC
MVYYEAIYAKKLKKRVLISNSFETYKLVKRFTKSRQEQCIVITLDKGRYVIGVHLVHIGTTNTTYVAKRDIFYKAIMDNAYSLIICHNHTGDAIEPSKNDLKFSDEMYKAGSLMDIKVVDQLIISKYGYTSIKPSIEAVLKGEINIK